MLLRGNLNFYKAFKHLIRILFTFLTPKVRSLPRVPHGSLTTALDHFAAEDARRLLHRETWGDLHCVSGSLLQFYLINSE